MGFRISLWTPHCSRYRKSRDMTLLLFPKSSHSLYQSQALQQLTPFRRGVKLFYELNISFQIIIYSRSVPHLEIEAKKSFIGFKHFRKIPIYFQPSVFQIRWQQWKCPFCIHFPIPKVFYHLYCIVTTHQAHRSSFFCNANQFVHSLSDSFHQLQLLDIHCIVFFNIVLNFFKLLHPFVHSSFVNDVASVNTHSFLGYRTMCPSFVNNSMMARCGCLEPIIRLQGKHRKECYYGRRITHQQVQFLVPMWVV